MNDNSDGLVIEKFDHHKTYHKLKQFDCGNPFLNRFARRNLKTQVKRSVATAYVLLDTDQQEKVIGYYTLHAFALSRHALSTITNESLPHMVPVTRLGMLAIHKDYQHQRLGKRLLRHAMLKTLQASGAVGSKGLYLDAEQDAIPFYQALGFISLETGVFPQPMFLNIDTIRAAAS